MSERAKHSGSKSLVIINKLPAGMLRPYEYIRKTEMQPEKLAVTHLSYLR